MKQVIVDVDSVYKKYCRRLKQSMWYGVQDLYSAFAASKGENRMELRPREFFAVKDASFKVRQGECVAMLGPNGAGKSTMLKMLNGLIKPDNGTIKIRGRVGALIELGTGFNPILSGRENVYINAAVLGLGKSEVDRQFDEIVDFANIPHAINDPVQTYSSGMRVRLGFAVAAHLRPQLLLIDEVLAVGDVGFRMKCFAHLQNLASQGVSIILVSHAVSMLSRVCERAVVFGQGKIEFDGDLERGVGVYEQLLDYRTQKRAEHFGAQLPGATIESVQVLDQQDAACKEFQTGEPIRIRIHLASDSQIDGARLIVALRSPSSGILASIATPHQDFRFDLQSPGTKIDLTLTRPPLLIGAYNFNVSLYGPELTDFYQRKSGVGGFQIVGPATDASGNGIGGVIELEHQWQQLAE